MCFVIKSKIGLTFKIVSHRVTEQTGVTGQRMRTNVLPSKQKQREKVLKCLCSVIQHHLTKMLVRDYKLILCLKFVWLAMEFEF